MKNVEYNILILALILAAGCSGPSQVAAPDQPRNLPSPAEQRLAQLKHDRAIEHFIDAVALDAKERYAEAILEYQEVIRLEPNAAAFYGISKDYALLAKPQRAAEAALEAVKLDSTKIPYRENLASIYLSMFHQDLAIREYEIIVRLDSNSVKGWFNLARLYQQRQPLKALAIYEKLLADEPGNWDVLFQAAEVSGVLGRYEKAADFYKQMLEIDPGNRPLQRQLAETYSKAGKIDEAVKLLETMHEVDQKDEQVTAILAEIYLDRGEYAKALPLYQSLLGGEKPNPELRLRIGVAYAGQIQRDSTFADKAREIFEQLKIEMPDDFRVYWYLGIIAANQKQDSLAANYFERVTSLNEKNAEAWWFLGSNYFDRGDFQKVLGTMERARTLFPNDSRFYMLTGLAYSRLGQPEPAIQMLERSYRLNPKDLNTLGQLALTYDGLRRWKECDSLYEEALRIDSTSAAAAIVLNNYGYSLAERGLQLDRALKMALRAVELEPNNASYLDTLGWIYYKISRYDDAQRYIARAVETGQASAVVNEHLGDVYYKLGNKDKATEYWERALNMDKSNQALKEKIERGSL
ncbi:MAG: tetratricopeptide repeat protein [Methanothrix sp.]|nr:tetratricopeptide repeat protein [Methanothrix sp.]